MLIAFYYLLRIGEYTTKTRRKKKTRTRQFRENNVMLFKLNADGELQALTCNVSPEEVMSADAATLRISNKKNGHKGACFHHMAKMEHLKECPVRSLGRRIVHIWKHLKSGKAFLCEYWGEVGCGIVTDNDIRLTVKYSEGCLDYLGRGILLIKMGTHSLQSGGACVLSLLGHKPCEIMKMGRWDDGPQIHYCSWNTPKNKSQLSLQACLHP